MTLIVLRNILSWWLFKNSFGCIPVSSIQWGLFPKQTDCSDLLSPFLITINTDSRRITNSWSKTNHQFQRLYNHQVQIQNLTKSQFPNASSIERWGFTSRGMSNDLCFFIFENMQFRMSEWKWWVNDWARATFNLKGLNLKHS